VQRTKDEIKVAKDVSISSILVGAGMKPSSANNAREFYRSPFRNENQASFVVSRKTNTWKDWGDGSRGDSIDLVMKIEGCSFSEAINYLLNDKRSYKKHDYSKFEDVKINGIDIIDVEDITNEGLIHYSLSRGISIEVLKAFCKQVTFSFTERDYVIHRAIGFKNDKGGWELRNGRFKGGNSPKTWSTIREKDHPPTNECDLFEGFFDFMSHMQLYNLTHPTNTTIILNSLSFSSMVKDELDVFDRVNLYIDNNAAAEKNIDEFFTEDKFCDKRSTFDGYEDYNEFLINK
jgi:hypothetical protein